MIEISGKDNMSFANFMLPSSPPPMHWSANNALMATSLSKAGRVETLPTVYCILKQVKGGGADGANSNEKKLGFLPYACLHGFFFQRRFF